MDITGPAAFIVTTTGFFSHQLWYWHLLIFWKQRRFYRDQNERKMYSAHLVIWFNSMFSLICHVSNCGKIFLQSLLMSIYLLDTSFLFCSCSVVCFLVTDWMAALLSLIEPSPRDSCRLSGWEILLPVLSTSSTHLLMYDEWCEDVYSSRFMWLSSVAAYLNISHSLHSKQSAHRSRRYMVWLTKMRMWQLGIYV